MEHAELRPHLADVSPRIHGHATHAAGSPMGTVARLLGALLALPEDTAAAVDALLAPHHVGLDALRTALGRAALLERVVEDQEAELGSLRDQVVTAAPAPTVVHHHASAWDEFTARCAAHGAARVFAEWPGGVRLHVPKATPATVARAAEALGA